MSARPTIRLCGTDPLVPPEALVVWSGVPGRGAVGAHHPDPPGLDGDVEGLLACLAGETARCERSTGMS